MPELPFRLRKSVRDFRAEPIVYQSRPQTLMPSCHCVETILHFGSCVTASRKPRRGTRYAALSASLKQLADAFGIGRPGLARLRTTEVVYVGVVTMVRCAEPDQRR